MIRKWLAIGISTVSVILLILTSLSNVVGYQTVQTSQKNLIEERINQRELLFQTICDIVNNKEIQLIIIKSQISRGISPPSEIPVITKNQLKQMFIIGLLLSRFITKSRLQSMVGKYQFNNQDIQKEITTVVEKDSILNAEITQLKNSKCNCDNTTTRWSFPILCTLLIPFLAISFGLLFYDITEIPMYIMMIIGFFLNCSWYTSIVP